MRTLVIALLLSMPLVASANDEYEIEAAENDDTFIINGAVFKAYTLCPGWQKGDKVIFLKGNTLRACVTAKVMNLTTGKSCKLWCE